MCFLFFLHGLAGRCLSSATVIHTPSLRAFPMILRPLFPPPSPCPCRLLSLFFPHTPVHPIAKSIVLVSLWGAATGTVYPPHTIGLHQHSDGKGLQIGLLDLSPLVQILPANFDRSQQTLTRGTFQHATRHSTLNSEQCEDQLRQKLHRKLAV